MSYNPINWVNGETPINDTNLNNMDKGISDAHSILAEHERKINDFANQQLPEEYVKEAVDTYVENNSAGFATDADLAETKSQLDSVNSEVDKLSGEIAENVKDIDSLVRFTHKAITHAFNGDVVWKSSTTGVFYNLPKAIPSGQRYSITITSNAIDISSFGVRERYADGTDKSMGHLNSGQGYYSTPPLDLISFAIYGDSSAVADGSINVSVSYDEVTNNSLEERIDNLESDMSNVAPPIYYDVDIKPPYWILHLDCARKYFTVDNVKAIIDKLSVNGFNQLQLHFSEDSGFRFALDDMTITTEGGTTYDLTPCLGGNESPTLWYSQTDMDTIISYAKSKNIDIVPSLDMPAHMGRILWKFPQFKYNNSNTLDITNEDAVKFAKAIVDKYCKYFSSKGCHCWNIGFDEIVGSTGFDTFYQNGDFHYIIDFTNEIMSVVKKYNLIPRIYNEPVFYNKDYNFFINKDIEVYYWYTDWAEYTLPDVLQNSGYKLINNSYFYYWIMGNSQNSVTVEKLNDTDLLLDFHNRTVFKNGYGATLCAWCDSANTHTSNGDGGDYVVSEITPLIVAFGNAIKRALS